MINRYSSTPLVKIPKKKGKSSVRVFNVGDLLKIETDQGVIELSLEQAIYLGGVAQSHEEVILKKKLFNITNSKWEYSYYDDDGYDNPGKLICFGVKNDKFSINYEYHRYENTFSIRKMDEATYDVDTVEGLSAKQFKKLHDKYMRLENFI